ncbi:MAG: hypothetical protein OXK77_14370 [Gemmatimonadota bacterium]|nr:hypothetical protein [Gemmatimonadota bacterium]MDE2863581.1 hypothetical protein [Gemmatimonadota bacterium]
MAPTTALRYVHLLNTSYQLVRVEPYAVNRTKGAEVDLVIETPGRLIPVEVKGRPRLHVSDARHLKTFMRDYRDEAPAGVVIYASRETYWLTDGVLAVPWDRVA